MRELLTNAALPAGPRSVHEINQRVRQIERGHEGQALASMPEQLAPSNRVLVERASWRSEELNGIVPVQIKSPAESNGMVALPLPTGPPAQSNGNIQTQPDHRIFTTWGEAWLVPFRALREFYWLLDKDAKARGVGLQTVGHVTKMETEVHNDPEHGTSYTYHVTYDFRAAARTHTAKKQVDSLGGLRRDDVVKVYYLPDTYPLHIHSAIDLRPRALGEHERATLEAGQRLMRQNGYTVR